VSKLRGVHRPESAKVRNTDTTGMTAVAKKSMRSRFQVKRMTRQLIFDRPDLAEREDEKIDGPRNQENRVGEMGKSY
jgi:hypothetical protein